MKDCQESNCAQTASCHSEQLSELTQSS